MRKTARVALSENVKTLQGDQSRRAWAASHTIDVKTVERAEKDEGEKGISLQGLDDIAKAAGVPAWHLLVPGFDPKKPPRLTTDPVPKLLPLTIGAVALHLADAVQALGERHREACAAAVARLLTKGPDRHESEAIDILTGSLQLTGMFGLDEVGDNPVTSNEDDKAHKMFGGFKSSKETSWEHTTTTATMLPISGRAAAKPSKGRKSSK